MTIFTLVLNIMCESGLSVISWVIVFLPFILMTYITAVLMYVFGLQPSSSQVPSTPDKEKDSQTQPPSNVDPHSTEHTHPHVPSEIQKEERNVDTHSN